MDRVATDEASGRGGLSCVTSGQDRNQDVPVRTERQTTELCSAEGIETRRMVRFRSKGDKHTSLMVAFCS